MSTPKLLQFVRSFLFPDKCIFCGVHMKKQGEFTCDDCAKALPHVKSPVCERCGKTKSSCTCSALGGLWFERAVSPFEYADKARHAVHMIKFRSYTCAIPTAARYMLSKLHEIYGSVLPFDVITFVPMTRRGVRRRGYNQAELLARSISELCGIPCAELLKKVVETKAQRTLNERQRRTNVLGCFEASEKASRLRVLLVDDVMTSGATLNECAKALAFVSASSVSCVTFATTIIPRHTAKPKRGKINK